MHAAAVRLEVSRLADDLSWLETHSHSQPDREKAAARLRLAASLVRNVLGPALDGQGKTPIHIAVVGGAGTGKSTVVNFLAGDLLAEANPQAGYTRHPTAYILGQPGSHWTGHLGFLGPLRRLEKPAPANLDEDVFQVVEVPCSQNNPLGDVVIWDCPDMTTWAAGGYQSRLIEVAGLADVIVHVASDERYNDEAPTQFLHKSAELADPVGKAAAFRVPLLNQVMLLADPQTARDRTLSRSIEYLENSLPDLLGVARQDLAAMEVWKGIINQGMNDLERRYQSDFLEGEEFLRFDESRDRLLDLLELPGAAKGVGLALKTLRFPYRFLRNAIAKAVTRPMPLARRESDVLGESMKALLDHLQADSLKRGDQGPFWKHVREGFNGGLTEQATDRYRSSLRDYQLQNTEATETAARDVCGSLEQNHSAMATLRVGKLLLDITAIGLGFWAGGLNWPTLIYIPVFLSLAHQLAEIIVWQYVEGKRRGIRKQQLDGVRRWIIGPMTAWLDEWPVTGGSSYEKLQAIVLRLPAQIDNIKTLIAGKQA